MRFKDKVAVITGGASGIGKRTVERWVAEGGRAVIADIQDDRGARLVEDLGTAVRYIRCDVTVEADIAAAVALAKDTWGRLDLMFNNAGIGGDPAPVLDISVEGWDFAQAVLVRSVVLGIKHAGAVMKEQGGGVIVNTASVAGLIANATPIAYGVAKNAVTFITKAAALELAEYNIRVNCICPGLIATPIIGKASGLAGQVADRVAEDLLDAGRVFQPIPKPGMPDDIANGVLFFADDNAAFVSGVVMPIDGAIAAGMRPRDTQALWSGVRQVIEAAAT
ncbi:SDR family NAD(P)-dependent oxidoreductase [Zavarzinia sp. CC-PAN008]|uniref:SDR family NAD(P)-dependent oxidoreductase n=1 Tax=Zavarzinia sp. CC-PAN008 TaxID=3243332 RepID=UPI003F745391